MSRHGWWRGSVRRFVPEEVRRCVVDCAAMFDGARVRTYLPVLIERAAADRLASMLPMTEEARA